MLQHIQLPVKKCRAGARFLHRKLMPFHSPLRFGSMMSSLSIPADEAGA